MKLLNYFAGKKNKKLATTIGSLPHIDPVHASELILKFTPQLPAWPQLPKRSFKENMYVQFSEKFPGIVINEKDKKIYVSIDNFYSELERFYEHFLANDLNYFAISKDYAAGFHRMISADKSATTGADKSATTGVPKGTTTIKGQITGPVTFGLSIKDLQGQPIFYNNELRDAVIKNCTMKSRWQIKKIQEITKNVVLFIDEPYLAAYGSAFTSISKEEIIKCLQEVITGIKENFKDDSILIGVHCCANTDWSILLDTDIDILSFDAYEFFDNLVLYTDKLKEFINRGKILAWGIVPTNEDMLKKENVQSLTDKFNNYLEVLVSKGIEKEKIICQSIFTPSCGVGSCSEESAEQILKLLAGVVS